MAVRSFNSAVGSEEWVWDCGGPYLMSGSDRELGAPDPDIDPDTQAPQHYTKLQAQPHYTILLATQHYNILQAPQNYT